MPKVKTEPIVSNHVEPNIVLHGGGAVTVCHEGIKGGTVPSKVQVEVGVTLFDQYGGCNGEAKRLLRRHSEHWENILGDVGKALWTRGGCLKSRFTQATSCSRPQRNKRFAGDWT